MFLCLKFVFITSLSQFRQEIVISVWINILHRIVSTINVSVQSLRIIDITQFQISRSKPSGFRIIVSSTIIIDFFYCEVNLLDLQSFLYLRMITMLIRAIIKMIKISNKYKNFVDEYWGHQAGDSSLIGLVVSLLVLLPSASMT